MQRMAWPICYDVVASPASNRGGSKSRRDVSHLALVDRSRHSKVTSEKGVLVSRNSRTEVANNNANLLARI